MFTISSTVGRNEDDGEKHGSSQCHQNQNGTLETGAGPARNSETEVKTEDSSGAETDDSEDWREIREHQPGLVSLQNHEVSKSVLIRNSNMKPGLCSDSDHSIHNNHPPKVCSKNHREETLFRDSGCEIQLKDRGGPGQWRVDELQPPKPIKEEKEEVCISQANTSKIPLTFVSVKREDDEVKHQQMETGADGQDHGAEELKRHLQPETEVKMEDLQGTDDSVDSDFWTETRQRRPNEEKLQKEEGKAVQKTFDCSECSKTFKLKWLLTQHMRCHTGEKPFTCSICNKSFKSKAYLNLHTAHHRGEKPFSCSVCDQGFAWYYQLQRHDCETRPTSELLPNQTEEKPEGETGADGEDCGGAEPARNSDPEIQSETLIQTETLVQTETKTNTDDSSEAETDDSDDDWQDTRTHRSGSKSVKDMNHKRPKTLKKPHGCSQCGKAFRLKSDLIRHIRIHTGEKPFGCSVCGRRFHLKSHLTSHMLVHTGEKPFGCSCCSKRFNHKSSLKLHMVNHRGERPFSCSLCRKRFNQKGHLKSHILVHTKEKPFSCSLCSKRFNHKSGLKVHMLYHSGEKPFSCSFCSKAFRIKSHLNSHMLVHTGEKPFGCSFCNKRFNHKGNLTSHMLVHTGDKPFSCSVCSKKFALKYYLALHMSHHRGEKPFSCSVCRQTFVWRYQLKQHRCVRSQGSVLTEVLVKKEADSRAEGVADHCTGHIQLKTEVKTEDSF